MITIAGWVFSVGVLYNRISNLEDSCQSLKARQTVFEDNFYNLSKTVTSIDTKVDLLLNNKILLSQTNTKGANID